MAVGRRAALAYPLLLGLGAIDAAGYSVIVPVAPAASWPKRSASHTSASYRPWQAE
jgi:hypothetical protein